MLVPNAFDLTPRIRPGRVSDQQLDDCLDDRMYRQGRALLGLKQSREHTRQKVAARHAPAIFPPADPHSVTSTTRDPRSSSPSKTTAPAQIAARSTPTAPAHSTGSAQMPGQRASAHISTLCAAVLPTTVTVAPIPGGGGGGGGGARRARSSTRSPATRTAKMRGGAAAQNIAVCDDGAAVSRNWRCWRCAWGDVWLRWPRSGGKALKEGDMLRCALSRVIVKL
jgi:hypothetical protein